MALDVVPEDSFKKEDNDDQSHVVNEQRINQTCHDQTPPVSDEATSEQQNGVTIDQISCAKSFFDLPAELQNQIYHHVLVSPKPIPILLWPPYIAEPALLRAHPIIRAAATSVFYGCNIFETPVENRLLPFVRRFNRQRLRMIRRLHLVSPGLTYSLKISKMRL